MNRGEFQSLTVERLEDAASLPKLNAIPPPTTFLVTRSSARWGAPMVKKKLVEGLISDGAKLLRELDRENFLVESMFWIHLPDDDYWRLVIASPNVDKEGSAAGYGRINQILRNIETAGLTLEDISL